MPFRSEAQKRYMYANHPEIAKKWDAEFPSHGKLPEHVSKKPRAMTLSKMAKIPSIPKLKSIK